MANCRSNLEPRTICPFRGFLGFLSHSQLQTVVYAIHSSRIPGFRHPDKEKEFASLPQEPSKPLISFYRAKMPTNMSQNVHGFPAETPIYNSGTNKNV